MSSCGRAIVGESGLAAAVGRSSSDTADVIGGFIGVTFSPIARVTIETGERTFASVAFPVSPTSTRVSSVLDELGEPNTARWRLGHWSPGDSTYVEAADGELDAVERGQDYWLITASRATVVEDGLTGFIVDDIASAARAVPLAARLDRRAIRRRFEERFTADRMARDYLALYQSVLHGDTPVKPDPIGDVAAMQPGLFRRAGAGDFSQAAD